MTCDDQQRQPKVSQKLFGSLDLGPGLYMYGGLLKWAPKMEVPQIPNPPN